MATEVPDPVGHPFVAQSECLEFLSGPPVRRRVRWFTDQGQPPGSQETCCPAGSDEWRAEASRRDDIERAWLNGSEVCHIDSVNVHPEAECPDGPTEQIRPSLPPFDQHDGQIRAAIGDDEAGKTATGPQIDHPCLPRRQCLDEAVRVGDGGVERGRPDRAVRLQ